MVRAKVARAFANRNHGSVVCVPKEILGLTLLMRYGAQVLEHAGPVMGFSWSHLGCRLLLLMDVSHAFLLFDSNAVGDVVQVESRTFECKQVAGVPCPGEN
jgi:hypothetical protein